MPLVRSTIETYWVIPWLTAWLTLVATDELRLVAAAAGEADKGWSAATQIMANTADRPMHFFIQPKPRIDAPSLPAIGTASAVVDIAVMPIGFVSNVCHAREGPCGQPVQKAGAGSE